VRRQHRPDRSVKPCRKWTECSDRSEFPAISADKALKRLVFTVISRHRSAREMGRSPRDAHTGAARVSRDVRAERTQG
jgi:hypothetical protein